MALPRTWEGLQRYLSNQPNLFSETEIPEALRPVPQYLGRYLGRIPEPKAKARARALLRSFLTPVQRFHFDETHEVVHMSVRPHQSYAICFGRSYNIRHHDFKKSRFRSLCCIPQGAHAMPDEDIMLAQLLMLRADEAAFLKRANKGAWEPWE